MEQTPDETAAFNAFTAELAGSEWRASLTVHPLERVVCLQIERPSPTPDAGVQCLVFCRPTFALAERSARKHIVKRFPA
jgi:hypothetical protein